MDRNTKKIVIAVDGFSSCGKSTMAKDLAKAIGYIYIDSGAMYRAVTLLALFQDICGTYLCVVGSSWKHPQCTKI